MAAVETGASTLMSDHLDLGWSFLNIKEQKNDEHSCGTPLSQYQRILMQGKVRVGRFESTSCAGDLWSPKSVIPAVGGAGLPVGRYILSLSQILLPGMRSGG